MTVTSTASRRALTSLTVLVAALTAAVVMLSSGRASASSHTATPQLSTKAVAFQAAMNRLWEDHITWTRMVIVDFAAGLPDLKTAEARLLRNQADIGNAIKPYYGAAAGTRLTQLLRAHILGAVPVLADAKAGDKTKLAGALAAWSANAHQIAVFLAGANPANWPLPMMDAMMKRHLALTTDEAVARLQGHWGADVRAYDGVHAEILEMADMLSRGIIAQFPGRFS